MAEKKFNNDQEKKDQEQIKLLEALIIKTSDDINDIISTVTETAQSKYKEMEDLSGVEKQEVEVTKLTLRAAYEVFYTDASDQFEKLNKIYLELMEKFKDEGEDKILNAVNAIKNKVDQSRKDFESTYKSTMDTINNSILQKDSLVKEEISLPRPGKEPMETDEGVVESQDKSPISLKDMELEQPEIKRGKDFVPNSNTEVKKKEQVFDNKKDALLDEDAITGPIKNIKNGEYELTKNDLESRIANFVETEKEFSNKFYKFINNLEQDEFLPEDKKEMYRADLLRDHSLFKKIYNYQIKHLKILLDNFHIADGKDVWDEINRIENNFKDSINKSGEYYKLVENTINEYKQVLLQVGWKNYKVEKKEEGPDKGLKNKQSADDKKENKSFGEKLVGKEALEDAKSSKETNNNYFGYKLPKEIFSATKNFAGEMVSYDDKTFEVKFKTPNGQADWYKYDNGSWLKSRQDKTDNNSKENPVKRGGLNNDFLKKYIDTQIDFIKKIVDNQEDIKNKKILDKTIAGIEEKYSSKAKGVDDANVLKEQFDKELMAVIKDFKLNELSEQSKKTEIKTPPKKEFFQTEEFENFFSKLTISKFNNPDQLKQDFSLIFTDELLKELYIRPDIKQQVINRYWTDILQKVNEYLLIVANQQDNARSGKLASIVKSAKKNFEKVGKGAWGGLTYSALQAGMMTAFRVGSSAALPVMVGVSTVVGALNSAMNYALGKGIEQGLNRQVKKSLNLLYKGVGMNEVEVEDLPNYSVKKSIKKLNIDDSLSLELTSKVKEDLSYLLKFDKDKDAQLTEYIGSLTGIKADGSVFSGQAEEQNFKISKLLRLATLSKEIKNQDLKEQKQTVGERQKLIKELIGNGAFDEYINFLLIKKVDQYKKEFKGELNDEAKNKLIKQANLTVEMQTNALLGDVIAQEKYNELSRGKISLWKNSYLGKMFDKTPPENLIQAMIKGAVSGATVGLVSTNAIGASVYMAMNRLQSTFRQEILKRSKETYIKTPPEITAELESALVKKDITSGQIRDLILEARSRIKLPDIKEADRAKIEVFVNKLSKQMILIDIGDETNKEIVSLNEMAKQIIQQRQKSINKAVELTKKEKKAKGFVGLVKKFIKFDTKDKIKILLSAGGQAMIGAGSAALGAEIFQALGGGAVPEGHDSAGMIDRIINRSSLGIYGAFDTAQADTMIEKNLPEEQEFTTIELTEADKQAAMEELKEELMSGFNNKHVLLNNQSETIDGIAIDHKIDNGQLNTEVTIAIGKDGAYETLDQGLRRLVIDNIDQSMFDVPNHFGAMDAARVENMVANVREVLNNNTNIINKFTEVDFDSFIEYHDGQLFIKDYQAFSEFVSNDLFTHAQEIISEKSDALAYVDESQDAYAELLAVKDQTAVVDDLANNQLVKDAEQRIFSQQADYIKSLGGEGAEILVQVGAEQSEGIVKLNIGNQEYQFEINNFKLVKFDDQVITEPISINSALKENLIDWNLKSLGVDETKVDSYGAAAQDLNLLGRGKFLLAEQDIAVIKHVEDLTNGFQNKFELFRDNDALLNFSIKHQDLNIDVLDKLNRFASASELSSGILNGANKEPLDFVLRHMDDQGMSMSKVTQFYALQKNIHDSVDKDISLDNLYNLNQQGIYFKPHETLEGAKGLMVSVTDYNGKSMGALFISKEGVAKLYNSENLLLGKQASTFTDWRLNDDKLTSENSLRECLTRLQAKERSQNILYSELELASEETGFFKWLSVDMDKDYLYKGLDAPANSLATGEAFKQALHDIGKENNLKQHGQDNNFDKMYDIICKKVTGIPNVKPEQFAKDFEQHPPLENETIRHYLARVVGDKTSVERIDIRSLNIEDQAKPEPKPQNIDKLNIPDMSKNLNLDDFVAPPDLKAINMNELNIPDMAKSEQISTIKEMDVDNMAKDLKLDDFEVNIKQPDDTQKSKENMVNIPPQPEVVPTISKDENDVKPLIKEAEEVVKEKAVAKEIIKEPKSEIKETLDGVGEKLSSIKIELGPKSNKELIIEKNPTGDNISTLIVHETEIDGLEAARQENFGEIAYLKGDGGRNYIIEVGDKTYQIDPNNAFSEAGIKKDFIDQHGVKEWKSLGQEGQTKIINESLDRSKVIVDNYLAAQENQLLVLHQNHKGGFGIKSYLPSGELAKFAADVYVNDKMNPDTMVYVTEKNLFEGFKAKGINVILQNNDPKLDDGSISYWAAKHNKPYTNIEVVHGNHNEQVKIIKAYKEIIKQNV